MVDGTVRAWGGNTSGQLGNGTFLTGDVPVQVLGIRRAKDVAAGGRHSLALLENGTVRAWGSNSLGRLGNGTAADSAVPVQVARYSRLPRPRRARPLPRRPGPRRPAGPPRCAEARGGAGAVSRDAPQSPTTTVRCAEKSPQFPSGSLARSFSE